jgi:hypothetical protein
VLKILSKVRPDFKTFTLLFGTAILFHLPSYPIIVEAGVNVVVKRGQAFEPNNYKNIYRLALGLLSSFGR